MMMEEQRPSVILKKSPWVNDSESTNCWQCKSGFTAFNRRHHCRSCGHLFCGNCSSSKIAIPELEYNKPVRACDCCYHIIVLKQLHASQDHESDIRVAQGVAEMATEQMYHTRLLEHGVLKMCLSLISSSLATLAKGTVTLTTSVLLHAEPRTKPPNQPKPPRVKSFSFTFSSNDYSQFASKEEAVILYASTALLQLATNVSMQDALVQSPIFIESILSILRLEPSETGIASQIQLNACCIIISLTSTSEKNKVRLTPLVTAPLSLLASSFKVSRSVVIKAAEALELLATDERFIHYGGLSPMILLALTEDIEFQSISAKSMRILSNLFANHNKIVYDGGLYALIALISYSHSELVIVDVLHSIDNLACNADSQQIFVKQGGLSPIVNLLNERKPPFSTDALIIIVQTIEKFAAVGNYRKEFTRQKDVLNNLIRLAKEPTPLDLRLTAMRTIGILALNEDMKKCLQNTDFMRWLVSLRKSPNKEIRDVVSSVLSRFEEQ